MYNNQLFYIMQVQCTYGIYNTSYVWIGYLLYKECVAFKKGNIGGL